MNLRNIPRKPLTKEQVASIAEMNLTPEEFQALLDDHLPDEFDAKLQGALDTLCEIRDRTKAIDEALAARGKNDPHGGMHLFDRMVMERIAECKTVIIYLAEPQGRPKPPPGMAAVELIMNVDHDIPPPVYDGVVELVLGYRKQRREQERKQRTAN